MREVSVSAVISAPREEVFDFVADLAARPSFTDHFMEDYRLARVQPVGLGAAARFKLDPPLANAYAELTITRADRLQPAPAARQRLRGADDHAGRPAAPDRRGDSLRPSRPQPVGGGLRLHP